MRIYSAREYHEENRSTLSSPKRWSNLALRLYDGDESARQETGSCDGLAFVTAFLLLASLTQWGASSRRIENDEA